MDSQSKNTELHGNLLQFMERFIDFSSLPLTTPKWWNDPSTSKQREEIDILRLDQRHTMERLLGVIYMITSKRLTATLIGMTKREASGVIEYYKGLKYGGF